MLGKITLDAESRGMITVAIESPEKRLLQGILISVLRLYLIKLSRTETAEQSVIRAFRALANFGKLKAQFGDLKVALDLEPEPRLADNGDLDLDLAELLGVVGEATAKRYTSIVLFIDELQYLPKAQLVALTGHFTRSTSASCR